MQAEAGHWGSHRPGVSADTHPGCLWKPLPTLLCTDPWGGPFHGLQEYLPWPWDWLRERHETQAGPMGVQLPLAL